MASAVPITPISRVARTGVRQPAWSEPIKRGIWRADDMEYIKRVPPTRLIKAHPAIDVAAMNVMA